MAKLRHVINLALTQTHPSHIFPRDRDMSSSELTILPPIILVVIETLKLSRVEKQMFCYQRTIIRTRLIKQRRLS